MGDYPGGALRAPPREDAGPLQPVSMEGKEFPIGRWKIPERLLETAIPAEPYLKGILAHLEREFPVKLFFFGIQGNSTWTNNTCKHMRASLKVKF
ncbi:MAG: hypothetical protein A3F17_03345 [Gammaproteobacteria bacterium RIFCSPHIGHO2_12_FULL_41_15]|nr:MAG: hypothetical protein A3F17_03345 [Gammaproteobacteria bacterium RIFCSPHIGHO2_12_FULL_41_15]